jgi:serine/threonine-protein kinase RsbW
MTPRESYSDRMTCQLQGGEAVIVASNAAREFGMVQRLAKDDCARMCIIVEELVANLYDHGGLTHEDRIALDLSRESGGIRVTLTDPGKPFDPRTATPKRKRPDRGGGVGIDIVRSWAQFVAYDVTADGNRLELLLPLQIGG